MFKPLIILLLCLFLFGIVALALGAEKEPTVDKWPAPGPVEAHRWLIEGKARQTADRFFVDRMFSQRSGERIQENYDVKIYDIAIRVNDTTETLHGNVRFVAEATVTATNEITFDLEASMVIDSIVAPVGLLSFSRSVDLVTTVLDRPYAALEQFEFTVYYHGHPLDPDAWIGGFAFHQRQVGGAGSTDYRYVISSLSQPYGARTWWPCKDRLDDKADSFLVAITVDNRFWVGSNGRLDSTVSAPGIKTFYYVEPHPMVTELFAIAVSDYYVYYDQWIYNNYQDTMPIVNAVYPEVLSQAQQSFSIVPEVLTIWSNKFGTYPFADVKYGHVNFEWPGGALEHQSMTSITNNWYGWSEYVVIHELAHQWYGDFVSTKSWADIWISEGWATYAEAIYYEVKYGHQYYHDYMDSMYWYTDGSVYRYDTTSAYLIFDGIVYYKGAWTVHMLRGVLGDSVFFDALQYYYNSEFAYGSLDTRDLCQVFEDATGRELDWFFQQWIFGSYQPHYQFAYWVEPSDSSGYDLYLSVDQAQTTDPQVFTMPIEFTFKDVNGGMDTIQLMVDERRDLHVLNFPEQITKVKLDPAHWMLKTYTEYTWRLNFVVMRELPHAKQHLPHTQLLDTRGGTTNNIYSIIDGSPPPGLTLDTSTGVISGAPTDSGLFTFTVYVDDLGSNLWDEAVFDLRVGSTLLIPGDVDASGGVDISDLIYFVDYSFNGGPTPPILNLADVDGSCAIDIGDIVYLVDYMFTGGHELIMGCVE